MIVSKALRAFFWPVSPVGGSVPPPPSPTEKKGMERRPSQVTLEFDPYEAKTARFLDDMKESVDCKRFAIIGVHGWFPMKVDFVLFMRDLERRKRF